jgi:hypothetical protein
MITLNKPVLAGLTLLWIICAFGCLSSGNFLGFAMLGIAAVLTLVRLVSLIYTRYPSK